MSNTERRKILNYRSASGISPNPDNIDYGEIAIGYKKDNEAIYIKNTTNEIVDFTPISIVNLTYNELKNLRDNSKLKPSQYYRITDFVTKVANDPEARSADHPFDLIVLALDKNKLHEECHAIQHEGDTYFADCNLAAWKIWYCLDNDKSRFAWADDTYKLNPSSIICDCYKYETKVDVPIDYSEKQFVNGTIYYRDEENDTIFPFMGNSPAYAWTSKNNITIFTTSVSPESRTLAYAYNTSGNLAIVADSGDISYRTTSYVEGLPNYDFPNGRGVIYRMIDEWGNDCPYDFKNVQFKRYAVQHISTNGELADLDGTYIGYNSDMQGLNIPDQTDFIWMYTFSLHKENEYIDYSSNCLYGPFTKDIGYFNSPKKGQCVYNTLSNIYGSVNIDGQFYVSLILNNIVLISEIHSLSENVDFPTEMVYNTFGTANFNMTLKDSPENNKFGNKCYNNIVGGIFNSFGNRCNFNTFGHSCHFNTFGDDCNYNLFGSDCSSNTFGNYCIENSFGNVCSDNTFGNYCSVNSFGNGFSYNTFGNYCSDNSFGNDCSGNSFGNDCSCNSFGNYFNHNALGNHVGYIAIPTANIYHTQILNGTQGTSCTNKLTIAFTPRTEYSQFAGLKSDGVLKIWVEADDPHDGIDCGNY